MKNLLVYKDWQPDPSVKLGYRVSAGKICLANVLGLAGVVTHGIRNTGVRENSDGRESVLFTAEISDCCECRIEQPCISTQEGLNDLANPDNWAINYD